MRLTRTQQILRQQSAAAALDPAASWQMTQQDLRSRSADLQRFAEAKDLASPISARLWARSARLAERRIRKRADRIILERQQAIAMGEQP